MGYSGINSLPCDKYLFHPRDMPGTFEQNRDGGEEDTQNLIWRKSVLGRRNSQNKGPGVGVDHVLVEGTWKRLVGAEQSE